MRKIFAATPLSKLIRRETKPGPQIQHDADLDTWIRQNIRITQHPVGTCRMGVGEGAVVDPQLRVIGVEGLRVVDASVMPDLIGGNINAPVIMIAERARPKVGPAADGLGASARARNRSGKHSPRAASPPTRITSRRLRREARNSAHPNSPKSG